MQQFGLQCSYSSRRCIWNGKQCRHWSDCSCRSSLNWVCTVCSDLSVAILRIFTVVHTGNKTYREIVTEKLTRSRQCKKYGKPFAYLYREDRSWQWKTMASHFHIYCAKLIFYISYQIFYIGYEMTNIGYEVPVLLLRISYPRYFCFILNIRHHS